MPTRVGSLIWNRINPTNKKCFGTVSPLCHCPGLVEGFCKIQRKRKYIVQRRKEVQAWGLTGITQTTKCTRESPSGACAHRAAAHTCTHMLHLSVCTSHFILWMFVFLTLVPCVCPTTQPLSSENWTGTLHNPAEERAGSDTRDPRETSSYLPGLSTWQCDKSLWSPVKDSKDACPDSRAQNELCFAFPICHPQCPPWFCREKLLPHFWPQIIRHSHLKKLCQQSDTECLKSQCRKEQGAGW